MSEFYDILQCLNLFQGKPQNHLSPQVCSVSSTVIRGQGIDKLISNLLKLKMGGALDRFTF